MAVSADVRVRVCKARSCRQSASAAAVPASWARVAATIVLSCAAFTLDDCAAALANGGRSAANTALKQPAAITVDSIIAATGPARFMRAPFGRTSNPEVTIHPNLKVEYRAVSHCQTVENATLSSAG